MGSLAFTSETLQLAQIGSAGGFTHGGASYATPLYCKITGNGDLLFFALNYYSASFGSDGGFCVMRVRGNGESCLYQSPNYAGGNTTNANLSNITQLSSDVFLTNNGNGQLCYFELPTQFANGAVFSVPEITFSPPSPCGVGNLINSFVDSKRGLQSFEFAQSFPDASNIYASIYRNNNLINGGFIGNFINGTDDYDRLSLALPPYINNYSGMAGGTYYYARGGIAFCGIGGSTPQNAYTGYRSIDIHNDSYLSCGSTGTKDNWVSSDTGIVFLQSDYPGLNYGGSNCAETDMAGAFMVGQGSHLLAFSAKQIIQFYTGGLAYIVGAALQGNKITLLIGNNFNTDYEIYTAPVVTFQGLSRRYPCPTCNYARGVPINSRPAYLPIYKTPRIKLGA